MRRVQPKSIARAITLLLIVFAANCISLSREDATVLVPILGQVSASHAGAADHKSDHSSRIEVSDHCSHHKHVLPITSAVFCNTWNASGFEVSARSVRDRNLPVAFRPPIRFI